MTPRRSKRGFALPGAIGAVVCAALVTALLPRTEPAPPRAADAGDPAPSDETGPVVEAVITLSSGRTVTGFLVEQSDQQVVIRLNGIDTTFSRARVAQIRVLAPVAERYRELRNAIDDADTHARMALAEWLRARRAYDLALEELRGILAIEPNNPDARTLHDWLEAQVALTRASREKSTRPADDERPRPTPRLPAVPTLSEQEINRIRVFEFDLSADTRVTVPESTMRELMVRFPESFPVSVEEREAILELPPAEQLRLVFKHRARDLYDTITVTEDPPTMETFKARVHGSHGWIVNACASTRCHGGSEAGRLRLLSDRPNSDQTAYTNFLILENFRLANGTPLINHAEPARSPLLHLALPRRASLYPHPEVDRRTLGEDWRFVFRSTSDRRFRESADWVASLYTPRPDYSIVYPPRPDQPAEGAEGQPPTTDAAPEPPQTQP